MVKNALNKMFLQVSLQKPNLGRTSRETLKNCKIGPVLLQTPHL